MAFSQSRSYNRVQGSSYFERDDAESYRHKQKGTCNKKSPAITLDSQDLASTVWKGPVLWT